MYLVSLPIPKSDAAQLVFCMTDPRAAGYSGPLECDAELESPDLCDSSWQAGTSARVVGQDPGDPNLYRLFESAPACDAVGFRMVGPMPVVAYRWTNELLKVPARKAG